METSTPIATSLRQPMAAGSTRTSLGGKVYEMTPLRKGRPSVLFQLDESNDDVERAEMRRSMALRRSIINLPPAVSSSSLDESGTVLSEDDIKTHLQICTKLHAENKINIKNAWSLKIIDVLKHMVTKNSPDILKVAGNSLEIAGKVYGLRVDDLHAEGMKLAGSLARNFNKRSGNDEEDEENVDPNAAPDGNQENRRSKKKQPKKRRPFMLGDKKHTVNADPKSWKRPLPKLESAAFSVRTDTGVSAVANLFTNNVKMDPAGYKFMFLSAVKAWRWSAGNDPSVEEATNRKFPVTIKPISNLMLCAPFRDFQVDEWNPDDENDLAKRASQQLDDVVCDDNGIPIPELDGSIHDFFQDRDNDDLHDNDAVEEEIVVPHIHQELEHIVDFRPTEQRLARSNERSEYSYNTLITTCAGQIDQIWAGPSHWKLKFIRRSRPVYTGQDQQKERKKKGARKKPVFSRIDIANLKPPIDVSLYENKRPKKKFHMVDENKITLPLYEIAWEEHLKNMDGLMTVSSMKPIAKCGDAEYEVDGYRYDNPNDSRYIPQDVEGDDGADLADDHFDNGENDIIGGTPDSQDNSGAGPLTGTNLIAAPQMVQQTYINYATRAKKMDMKKLKQAVWATLTGTSDNSTSAKVVPTTFSQLYKDVPKLLNEKMIQELSCPLVFVALLHLCNEENLGLQQEDFSDFKIFGPSTDVVSDPGTSN